MRIFRRPSLSSTAWRLTDIEARTDRALRAFRQQLRPDEQLVTGLLAFPQLPTVTGQGKVEIPKLMEFPLALAAATNQVFCFADPESGQRQVELPLAKLRGFQARGFGEAMLLFDGPTPDLQATPALRLPPISDLPPAMNAAAMGGFLSQLEEAVQIVTGRPFVNRFPTAQ